MKKTLAAAFTAALALQAPAFAVEPALLTLQSLDNVLLLDPAPKPVPVKHTVPNRQRGARPAPGGFGGGQNRGNTGGFGGGFGGGQNRGGQRQDPPRQEPPRQEPPRQEPPRQEPHQPSQPTLPTNPNRGGNDNRGGNRGPGDGNREPGNGNRNPGNPGGDPNRGGDGNRGGQRPPTVPSGPRPGRGSDGSRPTGQPQAPAHLPPATGGRGNGGNGGHGAPAGGFHGIPKPQRIGDRNTIDGVQRGNHDVRMPNRDDRGNNLPVDHGHIPSRGHSGAIHDFYRDGGHRGDIDGWNRGEHDGRDHWHDDGFGHRFCHRWEGGFDWYIWYIDGIAISMRWYGGYFWYYDPVMGRWVYLYNDAWWYPDPVDPNAIYLYDQDSESYYQYGDAPGGGSTLEPEQPAAGQPQQPQDAGKSYYSTDGTRVVQVSGQTSDAFLYLYDAAGNQSGDPIWLGNDVSGVYFRYDANGAVTSIMVLSNGGSFSVFDGNGVLQAALSSTPAQPDQDQQQPEDQQPDPNQQGSDDGGSPQASLKLPSIGAQAVPAVLRSASFNQVNQLKDASFTW